MHSAYRSALARIACAAMLLVVLAGALLHSHGTPGPRLDTRGPLLVAAPAHAAVSPTCLACQLSQRQMPALLAAVAMLDILAATPVVPPTRALTLVETGQAGRLARAPPTSSPSAS